jgi:hypothetical protein
VNTVNQKPIRVNPDLDLDLDPDLDPDHDPDLDLDPAPDLDPDPDLDLEFAANCRNRDSAVRGVPVVPWSGPGGASPRFWLGSGDLCETLWPPRPRAREEARRVNDREEELPAPAVRS